MRLGLAALALATPLVLTGCDQASGPQRYAADFLVIHGETGTVNRGPIDPVYEPLLDRLGIEFEVGFQLNTPVLEALPQYEIRTDFPEGGDFHTFSGPRLSDVLALADIRGDTLRITAIDGYQRDVDLERIRQFNVVLAVEMDGRALPLGGFGPAMLVWPRQTDEALFGMPDDDWVWGVLAMEALETPQN